MELNYEELNTRLCQLDTVAALINYIFLTQGGDSKRLNYKAAAEKLNVSERTIGRYIDLLADKKLIFLSGERNDGVLRLSEDILKKEN